MRWFTELAGILCCVQGIGGGISAVLDGSRSWFAVRWMSPESLQLPAAIVLAVAGALILQSGARKRQRN